MSFREGLKPDFLSMLTYSIIIVLASLLIGSFNLYNNLVIDHWRLNLFGQAMAFFALGTAHVLCTRSYLPRFAPHYAKGTFISLFITLIIGGALSILFFLKHVNYTAIVIVASTSFFLPSITTFSFHTFLEIPGTSYDVWYKRNNLLENRAFVFLTSVSIKIKVAAHLNDKKEKIFTCTVPAQMEFGKLFHYFTVQQLNKDILIDTEDENGNSLGWLFYREGWGGYNLKPIDPEKNLWENQVRPNATIVARRVPGASLRRANSQLKKAYEL